MTSSNARNEAIIEEVLKRRGRDEMYNNRNNIYGLYADVVTALGFANRVENRRYAYFVWTRFSDIIKVRKDKVECSDSIKACKNKATCSDSMKARKNEAECSDSIRSQNEANEALSHNTSGTLDWRGCFINLTDDNVVAENNEPVNLNRPTKEIKNPKLITNTRNNDTSSTFQDSKNIDLTQPFRQILIDISPEQWHNIKPIACGRRQVLPSEWRDFILSVLENECSCVIVFGYSRVSMPTSRKRNVPFIRQDAHCTFENCCHFHVQIPKRPEFNSNIKVTIDIEGEENHGTQPRRFRRTTGKEAIKIADMLSSKRPEEVFEDLIDKSSMPKLLAGNFNTPKSLPAIRRIKSLLTASESLHKNVVIELDMLHKLYFELDVNKKIKGYIQRRGSSPFFVITYMEEQVKLLESHDLVLHFDATGSIFKKWQGFEKRMLLYSLVLPNKRRGEPCMPIAEMICNDHSTEMLSHMLFSLRLDVNRLQHRLGLSSFPAQLVVVDFSWALIHAVFHSLNDGMTINIYLADTYNCLIQHGEWKKCTGVFLCANHVIHIVARKMASLGSTANKDCKKAFLQSFVLLQYTTTLEEAISTIRLMINILGRKYVSSEVSHSKKKMLIKLKKWKVCEKMELANIDDYDRWALNTESEQECLPSHNYKTIRNDSPWMKYFKSIVESEVEILDDENGKESLKTNKYYGAEILNYFLKHWLSLFPLWCMSISKLYNLSKINSWYSNAHVENWFSSVKSNHLRKSSMGVRIKVTKFIQTQREKILKRLKRFQLSEQRDAPCKKEKKIDKEDMCGAEEEWGQKKRNRSTYVKPDINSVHKLFDIEDSDSSDDTIRTTHSTVHSPTNIKINSSSSSLESIEINLDKEELPRKKEGKTNGLGKKFVACIQDVRYRLILMTRTGYHITQFDKDSLCSSNWLEMNIITAYLECFETDECAFWSNSAWNMVMRGRCDGPAQEAIMKTNWKKVVHIVIGRGERDHFVTIVINVKNRSIACVDSNSMNRDKLRVYTTKWNRFSVTYLHSHLSGNLRFTSIAVEHAMQEDGNSCGVLVCMFGRCIATGIPINTVQSDKQSMIQMRQEIWKTLEDNRDTERCCSCRQEKEPGKKNGEENSWLQCDLCRNYYHFTCAQKVSHTTAEEMALIDWRCHLCGN